MQKVKLLLTGLLMLVLTISLTSSVPITDSKMEDLKAKHAKATLLINEATKDGKTLTSKKLISIASEVKGEKLSFKERIALKVFNKKIAKLGADRTNAAGDKSQVVALILVILVGGLGIHRFYLGYTWQGVVQLLTAGGCGIWWLIDLIRIITGDLTPKNGSYASTL